MKRDLIARPLYFVSLFYRKALARPLWRGVSGRDGFACEAFARPFPRGGELWSGAGLAGEALACPLSQGDRM